MKILLAWVGATDLNAEADDGKAGIGPICAAVTETRYNRVVLLNAYQQKDGIRYHRWLRKHTESEIELVEDFARYIYLPRLKNPGMLISAIQNGLSLLLWPQESFAYDEAAKRYRGLRDETDPQFRPERINFLKIRH
ncbi:MAG: hypothetical protein J2P31_02630 [Blastocatellia bacterium]|nr:hypothetical protein [Blastocatellia bacterium]